MGGDGNALVEGGKGSENEKTENGKEKEQNENTRNEAECNETKQNQTEQNVVGKEKKKRGTLEQRCSSDEDEYCGINGNSRRIKVSKSTEYQAPHYTARG